MFFKMLKNISAAILRYTLNSKLAIYRDGYCELKKIVSIIFPLSDTLQCCLQKISWTDKSYSSYQGINYKEKQYQNKFYTLLWYAFLPQILLIPSAAYNLPRPYSWWSTESKSLKKILLTHRRKGSISKRSCKVACKMLHADLLLLHIAHLGWVYARWIFLTVNNLSIYSFLERCDFFLAIFVTSKQKQTCWNILSYQMGRIKNKQFQY